MIDRESYSTRSENLRRRMSKVPELYDGCDTCQGPGRTFAWNFKGSWKSAKGQMGYALVCHNPSYDAD